MAGSMTPAQIVAHMAEQAALNKQTLLELLHELARLAGQKAKRRLTGPRLGKSGERRRRIRRGSPPRSGATIPIAARRVVTFRVAKAAKTFLRGTTQK